jgi:hypothetical protein
MSEEFDVLTVHKYVASIEKLADISEQKAEKALETLADEKGDEFVKKILTHLSPIKIAAILRQNDYSSPSMIGWQLTPGVVADVLKADPLFWESVLNHKRSDNFFRIQVDALNLITSLILIDKDRNEQKEIFENIASDELSLNYLFLPFIHWELKERQTLLIEDLDTESGSADHLFEVMRCSAPSVAKAVYESVFTSSPSLVDHITDLWFKSFEHIDIFDTSIEREMFVPIR